MTIQWLGYSAFKIFSKDLAIAIDPHAETGLKMPKFQADILLVSHEHTGHNNAEAIKGDPFLINGPGEYEVKNVFVYGILADHDKNGGKDKGKVTMYMIDFEDLKIAHLSDLGQANLNEEQLEVFEGVDILLIPVGGGDTVDASAATKIISQIQPRVIIPMHYKQPAIKAKLDPLDKFLKEYGVSNPEKIDKLKISKKDLPQEETKVIVLTAE